MEYTPNNIVFQADKPSLRSFEYKIKTEIKNSGRQVLMSGVVFTSFI